MVFQIGQIVVHMSEPCLPKHSSTAVVIGQDLGSEKNYTAAVGAHAHPFGLMSYISLRIGPDGEIEGLESPTDYGSGVEWVLGILDHYQLSALQLGLWLIDSFDKLPTHEFDRNLAQLGKFIASTGRPFYIRIGYEFESVANHYPPDQYVAAFRYVVDYFRSSKVTNVHYVWHAAGFAVRDGLSYDAWYPGRDYVDWCGVSLFQQPYHCGQQIDCPTMLHADEFATYCKERGIPMMIAESAPFGGIVEPTEDSITAGNKTNEAGFVGASWSEWFEPVLAYIDRHDVRLWSYINCNWDAQQMWQEQHAPGEQWGDTRIEVNPRTLELWTRHVLENPRFLTHYPSPDEYGKQCEATKAAVAAGRTSPSTVAGPVRDLAVYWAALVSAALVLLLLWAVAWCRRYRAQCLRSEQGYEAIP